MNKATQALSFLGRTLGALFICTIVVVVPLLSLVEVGHFFQGGPKRSAQTLTAFEARAVDSTEQSPQLFKEPLITVTFDDGFETNYSVAMPMLHKHGIRTTQYMLSGTADDPSYLSWEQMEQMQRAGHEIACHTNSHADLTLLDDVMLDRELGTCKQELTKRFGPIRNFASPYGASNERTIKAISKYHTSQRNTLGDPTNGVDDLDVNTAKNFDRMNIIGVTVRRDTTMQEIRSLVEYTRKHNGWLVLTYHQANDKNSVYSLTPEQFNEQFKYLSGTDVRIATVDQVLPPIRQENVEY